MKGIGGDVQALRLNNPGARVNSPGGRGVAPKPGPPVSPSRPGGGAYQKPKPGKAGGSGLTTPGSRPAPIDTSSGAGDDDDPFVPDEEEASAEQCRSGGTQGDGLMMAKARRQRSPGMPSPVMP